MFLLLVVAAAPFPSAAVYPLIQMACVGLSDAVSESRRACWFWSSGEDMIK